MKGFRSKQAQEHACQRPGGDVSSRRNFLSQDWSPEQVAGLVPVSHECLYLFIYADKAQGGTLWRSLRCHKKKRKHYAGGRDRLVRLRNRHSTHVRPAAVESRACVDHWEGDTVIGAAHKHAIVTVVEPKSGFAVLSKVKNKAPTAVSPAIIDQLKPYAARVVTLPYGVGKEFVDHARIDDELD